MRKADRKKERFRNEWKYLISTSEKEVLNLRMKPLMKLDPHAENGGYLIRSLYFDDYWNSAYEEKESGVLMRKKYRIRIYNYSAESIKLERKKKFGSYIYKEDAPLTKDEVQKILSGEYEFLLKSPYSLCREFYIECMSNMMRPRTIVDYEREPWIMDEGTVRITFDTDVRAAVGSYDNFRQYASGFICTGTGKTDHGSEIYRDAASDSEKSSAAAGSRIYSSFQICTVL